MGSSGRRGTPRTKRPLLVSARSLDCPAPSSCTQHVAGPAAPLGWGRNILLYKVGSLTTFGIFKITFHFKFMKTWTYSSPYFPFLPSRRKKKNQETLGSEGPQKLSSCSQEIRAHQHPWPRARSLGATFLTFQGTSRPKRENPAILRGLFWGA